MPVNSFHDYPMNWKPERESLGKGPLYLSLASLLERDILSGKLLAGTRLPPQRELADYLDLNFTTVTRAYDLCRSKKLVYGITGRGTFVASIPGVAEESRRSDCIDLGVVQGFTEVGAKEIVRAARTALARETAERLFSYGNRDGMERHREAARQWLLRCGVESEKENVIVFPGVQGALSSALLSVFRTGDLIAVDTFTYANFISLARLAHVKLVPIAGDAQGMLPAALARAAARLPIRGLFIMPRHSNPTAITLPAERRRDIAEICRAADLIVLEDDASFATEDEDRLMPLHALIPERTLYLSGTARLIAPGLRIAYVACPERVRGPLQSAFHHTTIKASALDVEILSEMILSGRAEVVLRKKVQLARKANRLFAEVFPALGNADGKSLFRTVPLPGTHGRAHEVEERAMAAGLRVLHSDRYLAGKGEAFLRVSLSSAGTMANLEIGLRRLQAFVAEKTGSQH
ncbi:MAG: PLP-dependent aminotransferase family protein [Kiritimatiellia bacterium]